MRTGTTLVLLVSAIAAAGCSSSKSGAPAGKLLNSVEFDTRRDLPVQGGSSPDAVLADLDLDRRLDLAIATYAGTIEIQLGRGDGTFATAGSVDAGSRVVAVSAGDVDRDGDVDLVALCPSTSTAEVLRNDGRAGFTRAGSVPVAAEALDTMLQDMNADGRPDLVVCANGSPQLAMALGAGDGTFQPAFALPLPVGASGLSCASGDINGDGRMDLVVTDAMNDRVLMYAGQADGALGPPVPTPVGDSPVATAIGDANGDGLADVVVANFADRSVTVLLQAPGAPSSTTIPVDGTPGRLLVGDVTGDQIADIAICRLDQLTTIVLAGRADGSLEPEVQLGMGGTPTRVLAGDVDGDGRADLVATGGGFPKLALWRAGDPPGLRGAVDHRSRLPSAAIVVAADFDRDGKAEVAAGGPEQNLVEFFALDLDARPFARARSLLTIDVGRPIFNLARGDFDRDGRVDIAVAGVGGVRILANRSEPGKLAFALVPPHPRGVVVPAIGPFEIAAADLDRDGMLDLVVADAGGGAVLILRAVNEHFEYEGRAVSIAVDGLPGGLAIADFTGDGYPDIAVSRHQAGRISILRNDSFGRFQRDQDLPCGAGPIYLRSADFDEDGRADLVVSNVNADELRVLLATSSGFRPLTFAAGERPTALLAADLNRDRNADLLVASLRGADFRILLGDGRGNFPTVLPMAGSYRALSADLADLNGNGLLDLVIGSLESDRFTTCRNISR